MNSFYASTFGGHLPPFFRGHFNRFFQNAITQSQEANREVSQLLNDFYSTPKTDPQVEELKRQVEELESRLETKPQTPPDPMEIAEKQYALAAKYFNNGEQRAEPARNSASKTVTVHPVRSLGEGVVTTLATVEPDSVGTGPGT